MAGYKGYSMSNNAIKAYSEGEKPLSKWTKQDVIEYIANDLNIEPENIKLLRPYKDYLYKSSWHHTSKFYNETDFYSVYYEDDDIEIDNQVKEDKRLEEIKELQIKLKTIEDKLERLNKFNLDSIEFNEDNKILNVKLKTIEDIIADKKYSIEILSKLGEPYDIVKYKLSTEIEKLKEYLNNEKERYENRLNELISESYNQVFKEGYSKMKIYLFPELTRIDKSQLNNYNLKYLGKFKSEDKDINDAVKGEENDLEKYASNYLGYELHPLYLYNEEEFPYDMLMEDAKEVVNHGKKKWVKTKEDDKVWNSLSEDDKYFLSMSLDMGFWFDEIKGNEDLEDRYNELSSKFHIMHDDIEEINEEFNNDDYDLDSFLKDAEVILVDDAKTFDINKWEQENEEEIYEELEEDYIKEDVDKKPKFIKYKLNNDDIKKVIDNIKTKDLNIIDYWKTNQFLKKNNLQKDDLKEVIHNIEIEDYKTNSKPENKDDYNEAVIFVKNSKIKDLGPFELYIKLDYDRIEENPVIVISIHSKRNLGLSENMHNKIHLRDIIKEKLIQGKSDRTLKKNIETEIKAGKDPKQAYAIAKYIQRKNMKEDLDDFVVEETLSNKQIDKIMRRNQEYLNRIHKSDAKTKTLEVFYKDIDNNKVCFLRLGWDKGVDFGIDGKTPDKYFITVDTDHTDGTSTGSYYAYETEKEARTEFEKMKDKLNQGQLIESKELPPKPLYLGDESDYEKEDDFKYQVTYTNPKINKNVYNLTMGRTDEQIISAKELENKLLKELKFDIDNDYVDIDIYEGELTVCSDENQVTIEEIDKAFNKIMNEYSDESLKEDKNIIDVKEKIKLIEPVYTDDDNVEYGTELWFDVVKKFNIEPLGDDEWVNLYITYNPVKGKIEEIKAFVDKSSGSEEIENVEQYFSSDELFDLEDMVDEEFQEIKDDWEEYTGKYYLSESLKEKLIQDKHMNKQLIADKYDYIKQDLNKENISYEYDEQETFKFYNYEDYRKAEEIICQIVGYDYDRDNDTLEIIVYEDELNEDINDEKYLISQDKFDKLYYKYIKAMNYLKEH